MSHAILGSALTRRTLLSGGAAFTVLGFPVPFARFFPAGMQPVALAQDGALPGKTGLSVLSDRPVNAETPPHLLDEAVTAGERMFVRNNGLTPTVTPEDAANWRLTIDGEVDTPLDLSIEDLKNDFDEVTLQLQIECGGNGRKFMTPVARGNQWTFGAVSCANWTGVRLRDVLEYAGIKDDAVYIGYEGRDSHLSQAPGKLAISRGVPMAKALEDESLIAWAMNGQPLPKMNGYPLRLVFGGWPASCSGKWLSRIRIRNIVHDGPKMTGKAYRVPCKPVEPGAKVKDEDMCIIESMPVKSLVTYPKSGAMIPLGRKLTVRGHAWAGDLAVSRMEVSIDFGQTWKSVALSPPANRLAWQQWTAELSFPQRGYYEVWARATDSEGRKQPMLVPGWNPKGYLNNACHRIAVKVT